MNMPDRAKKSNITVEKAFEVLLIFSEDRQLITAAEVSERFHLPRSTAYRYLATLKSCGLLEERVGGGYKLGPQVYALARAAARNTSLVDIAKPFLEALSRSSGTTVLLNQTLGGEIVTIDCVENEHVKISALKGSVAPVPAGASAKTFLAFNMSIDIDEFMAEAPLKKHAAKTVIDRKILTAKILEARRLGYAVNDEEVDAGVRAVAAPILVDGKASYCVSLVAPAARLPSSMIPAIGEEVKRCAGAISIAWERVRI